MGKRKVRLDDGTEAEIVWSGDSPPKNGGHTKGELLGPYDSPEGFWLYRQVKRVSNEKDAVAKNRGWDAVSSTTPKDKKGDE